MPRDVFWYLLRGLAIVGVIYALGGIRCTSTQIRREVITQQAENAEAAQIVETYIPQGPHRERVQNALKRSSELLEQTDTAREQAELKADEMSDAAGKWRAVKWFGISLITAATGFAAFRMFRR